MRFKELNIIFEARGLTARQPGETYVNRQNSDDVLTLENIEVFVPEGTDGFGTNAELMSALKEKLGNNYNADNKPTQASTAAIIAKFKNTDNQEQIWVRFINKVPPAGVHGTWSTPTTSLFLKQYQYGKSSKEESVPIKPADIILDDTPRTSVELAREVKNNVSKTLSGTKEEVLVNPIHDAVDQALSGTTNPIQMPKEFVTVVAKYAGEYLGPISVASGKNTNGDIKKMLDVLNVPTLAGTRVVFPRSKSEELIDSIFILPNGTRLGVSTKMKQGSGAASSLSGVAKLLNEEIEQKYPTGSQIIKLLGRESAIDGPLQVAKMYDIIDDNDIVAFKKLNKNSRNILDLQSSRLQNLTKKQNTKDVNDPSYRVFFHTLTAITNEMVMRVNKNTELLAKKVNESDLKEKLSGFIRNEHLRDLYDKVVPPIVQFQTSFEEYSRQFEQIKIVVAKQDE